MLFVASRTVGDDINVPITIDFAVGGTATYPTDYSVMGASAFTSTSGTIIIPAGQSSATMTITPIADISFELDESIILSPQPQAGFWQVGTGIPWSGAILNDDVPSPDPYFADVLLLIKPIGADNSTIFTDNSGYNRSVTPFGNAKILNNQAVFDGIGDYLSIPSSPSLAIAGDFTIELEYKSSQSVPFTTLLSRMLSGFTGGSWSLMSSLGNGEPAIYWASFSAGSPFLISSITTNDNTLHHLAWERFGDTHTLYIDGIARGNNTFAGNMVDTGSNLIIGDDVVFSNRSLDGKMNVVRITKYARYRGNFTPPIYYPIN